VTWSPPRILAAQAAATLNSAREYNERLAVLQNQMHPHFLFNALSGIAEMTVADPSRAERAILGLAALYRSILVSSRQATISLQQELDLVESYLELEKLRFGSRLSYRFEVRGQAAAALIPPLIVQPLVENSVNHGIAIKPEGGLVSVEATLNAGRVHVRVSDDGAGWQAGGSRRGAGLGLESIRRRLRLFYGSEAELNVTRSAGVTVDMFFPVRAHPMVDPAARSAVGDPEPAHASPPAVAPPP
jgi:LytS/YehU family sensor histidine kinase